MITEVGALVGIMKTLLEVAKSGSELFGGRGKRNSALAEAQERLAGIAEQLDLSLALSKMLPVWNAAAYRIPIWTEKLSDQEVPQVESELRGLIHMSIHDTFSGTFFRTKFEVLPGVDTAIGDFRRYLLDLERQLNGILPGDAVAWRRTWPAIKLRVSDLIKAAGTVEVEADRVHSELVVELRSAAAVGAA